MGPPRLARPESPRSPDPEVATAAPPLITAGPMLCRLRVWTEAEWAALPARERPSRHVHAPGLGWVGAVPIAGLN